jgi:tartrate-resistant acid phosphatase type 5
MSVRTWISFFVATAALVVACGSDDQTSSSTTSGSGNASTSSNGGGGSTAQSVGGSTTSSSGGNGGSSSAGGAGGGGSGTGGIIPGEVRIIAIGDVGEGNTDQHCLADAMSVKCLQDGCDAVLLTGDNFYDDGVSDVNDAQWLAKFEQPYDRIGLNGLPFYVVLGNHDYSPPILQQIVGSNGNKQAEIDYSALPVGTGAGFRFSDKWTMPAQWYDVDLAGLGILHIFGMDTVHSGDFFDGQDQLGDMSMRVATSTAVWKIAFAHHPRFTSGDHQLDNDLLNNLTAVSSPSMFQLQEAVYCNADVYLTGHDHNREYISSGQDPNCPNTHFLISGAGAKVRTSGASAVSNSQYYDESIEGFFYIVATGNQLVIESYDMSSDPMNCGPAGAAMPVYATTLSK